MNDTRLTDMFGNRTPYHDHAGFQRGSDTSMEAAAKATLTLTELQEIILTLLKTSDYTADECASVLKVHFMRIRPRFTELYKTGRIIKLPVKRPSALGNPQHAYITRKENT
jgi:predicted ArsR family transcriptional regulator